MRSAFYMLVAGVFVLSCGKKSSDDSSGAPAPKQNPPELSFTENINPILQNNCAPCHSDGSKAKTEEGEGVPIFVGHEDVLKQVGDDVKDAIQKPKDDKDRMPPLVSGKTLSDAD